MLNFISFGSGSSGNCYLLYTENSGLLIDLGIGIRSLKRFSKEYGFSLSRVGHILITHDHADHVKGVGKFSSEMGLPVYATRRVHEGINRNYCVRHKVLPMHAKYIEPGVSLSVGEFMVTPFSVPHDSQENMAFRIECRGMTFCLMTDVGHLTEGLRQMISDADYLVIEANYDVEMLKGGNYPDYLKTRIMGPDGHLSNVDCGIALAENATQKLKHVWLCHLSEENNHPELARKTVEQTLRSYGILAGKDFEIDVLKRSTPTQFTILL